MVEHGRAMTRSHVVTTGPGWSSLMPPLTQQHTLIQQHTLTLTACPPANVTTGTPMNSDSQVVVVPA